MERLLLLIASSLLMLQLVAVGNAALTSEEYWHRVIPDTPIPALIRHSLYPSSTLSEEKATDVSVGKGGVHVGATQGKPSGGTSVDVGKGGVHVAAPSKQGGGGTTVNVGGKGQAGVGVNVPGKQGKKPVVVTVKPGKNPFAYNYAATEDQAHDDPNTALFFSEKDLKAGKHFTVDFGIKVTQEPMPTFLPRLVADALPFSSSKLTNILNRFSVTPGSVEAEAMKQTLAECEEPAITGEAKHCATSLESMVDFATMRLGKEVRVMATTITAPVNRQPKKYTVGSGVHQVVAPKSVACHAQNYPYAVFFCHEATAARVYRVPLLGGAGSTEVDAVAVCHLDTSAWNPDHVAFKVLKVKPGSEPVCHFLPQDHLVWISTP
ncbi:BURP domain protein RD22 [Amborella trichopoda]|uniref:BURP domain-containing protein n=1 Tax=Amborella trichopoda TaxID=13333 RepID=W1NPF2_AMBTC|nr:BURP domain protein RD22 [Amborella trichopoda]ERM98556.1 hypothetical protein AMTR_s00109p00021460 [Amborella trichopoda]|eukprot:XP_006833278.1 BURP domain protein RD22 [Amborella trichopoda]